MSRADVARIAEAILSLPGANGFALVLGCDDQTIVLLNNVSAQDAGELLCSAHDDIARGGQRPALFN